MGKDGAPGEIRTPDPLVRSQVLYPAELRARNSRRPNSLFYQSALHLLEQLLVVSF